MKNSPSEITERLKMEQALQKSKEQLRILASQILSAQENERKRVALEVHDVLGSSLSAIKFKAEEALRISPRTEPRIFPNPWRPSSPSSRIRLKRPAEFRPIYGLLFSTTWAFWPPFPGSAGDLKRFTPASRLNKRLPSGKRRCRIILRSFFLELPRRP